MLREYKFQAETMDGKFLVNGYFKKDKENSCYIEDINGVVNQVKPESVVPLVGYDRFNDEVYEGDWLWDEDNEDYYQVKWDSVDEGFYLDSRICEINYCASKIRDCYLATPPKYYNEDTNE